MSEKEILLDFLIYLLKTKISLPEKVQSPHKRIVSPQKPPSYNFEFNNNAEKPPLNRHQLDVKSPHFLESLITERTNTPPKSDLDDLYKQLKVELEVSKQTLKEFGTEQNTFVNRIEGSTILQNKIVILYLIIYFNQKNRTLRNETQLKESRYSTNIECRI